MQPDLKALKVARWLSYAIGFVLVLLPFHEFLAVWLGSRTGHLDLLRIWKEILIVAVMPICAWLVWREKKLFIWFKKSWIFRLFLVYALLHFVLGWWAFAHNQVNASALIYGLIVNLRFIAFFLVCLVVVTYDSFLKDRWPKLVLWPAAIVIVFGFCQKLFLPLDFLKHFGYGPKTIPAYETIDNNLHYQRIQSTLRGANPLGAYLVFIITTAIACLKQWWRVAFVVMALAALFFSYSRSAWVGLGIVLTSLVFISHIKISKRLLYALVGVLIVLGAGTYMLRSHQIVQDAILHTSKKSTSVHSSNAERSSALKAAVRDIAHQPLGRGPGTAGPASARNTEHKARIAENYYLQLGQEVGVVGLVIFVTINLLVARELWHKRGDVPALVLLASFVGISFINLVSHAWADDTLSLLWWGLAGVATAPAILNINRTKNEKA